MKPDFKNFKTELSFLSIAIVILLMFNVAVPLTNFPTKAFFQIALGSGGGGGSSASDAADAADAADAGAGPGGGAAAAAGPAACGPSAADAGTCGPGGDGSSAGSSDGGGGIFGGPFCSIYQGQSCSSAPNACSQASPGTIDCNGLCSATVPPPLPGSYGQSCSTANVCGAANTGTYQCDGSCSAAAPPTNYGQSCSVSNVCGAVNTGTYQCDGSCSAPAPALPSNYGQPCTGPANSCGLRNFGSIGCTNNCSAQFAPPESQCQMVNTETTGTTLTATPSTTGINGYSDLLWQSDQSSCSLYNPANGAILATSTSGTLRVGPLPSATRYILTCGDKTVTFTVRTDFRFNEF